MVKKHMEPSGTGHSQGHPCSAYVQNLELLHGVVVEEAGQEVIVHVGGEVALKTQALELFAF
jgi:hypothetical protein